MAAMLVAQSAVVQPTPPAIKARAYILQDYDSGRVLAEVNADEPVEPASLTKMMTVYVVLAQLAEGKFQLDDPVLISKKAWKMGGSKMFIEVGKAVPVEDLLKGVIIQSGNDASVALAEFVAGDESTFADLMNRYAVRLGMTNTKFVNSSGLPHPDHYSTARDMANLAAALIRDFPVHYPLHAVREYTWNNIKQYNRNPLLRRDESVDGVKTGFGVDGFRERGLAAQRNSVAAALWISIFRDWPIVRRRCPHHPGARVAGRVAAARAGYR
jgi:D-alanyl-D-alanine carboxypeptidase (penicillin-binding protein 5/6)